MTNNPSDGDSEPEDVDDPPDIVLTHTAKSKAFRYLNQRQIESVLAGHSSPIYFDEDRETWLVPTTLHVTSPKLNHEQEKTVVLIVDVDDSGTWVIVTQPGDHYNWSEYTKVDAIGEYLERRLRKS